ncbi:MAG: hypothetical protein KUG59_08190 [Parvibaculaceae bacterium]|nr:hypothetical protein [Parvibaculaceae bacterium]
MSQTNDYQADRNTLATPPSEPVDYRQRHLQTSIMTLEQAINVISRVEDCLSEMAELVLDARMDTSRVAQKNAIQETYQEERQQIEAILQAAPHHVRQLLHTQLEEERLSFDPAGSLKIRLPAMNLSPNKAGIDIPEAPLAFRSVKALAQTTAHLDHAQGLVKHAKRHFAETLGVLNEQLGQVERVGAPAWSAKRPSHALKTDAAHHTHCE